MGSLMSEQLRDDQAPGLTQALVSLLGDVHLLISDGHYKAAGEQLSLAVQTTLFQPAAIDRAVAAAEKARFPLREGRSEETTSELQSLMRTTYALFCLTNKNIQTKTTMNIHDKDR